MGKEGALGFVVPHDRLQVSGILVLGVVHGRERVPESVVERGNSSRRTEGFPTAREGFGHSRTLFRAEAPPQPFQNWKEEIARMWRFTRNNGLTEGFHRKMKLIQ